MVIRPIFTSSCTVWWLNIRYDVGRMELSKVTVISLSDCNFGDEESLNGCNGGPPGTTIIQVVIEAEAQAGICRLMCT
jgi:hypothetical protein